MQETHQAFLGLLVTYAQTNRVVFLSENSEQKIGF
jgi:hypothetical protein